MATHHRRLDWAVVLGTLAIALVAARCVGMNASAAGAPDVPVPELKGEAEVPGPPPPECVSGRNPSGCAAGALCWFDRCAPVAKSLVQDATAPYVAGAVGAAVDDKGGALLAFHARRTTADAAGGETREDRLYAVRVDGGQASAPELLDSWVAGDAQEAGPQVAVLYGGATGGLAVVRGPNPLRVYRWARGAWSASTTQATGAFVTGNEGALAAAFDSAGLLRVAYHDLATSMLAVATLDRDDHWSVEGIKDLPDRGSRLTATAIDGNVVFAHAYEGTGGPSGGSYPVLFATQRGALWDTSSAGLAEGLVVPRPVVGLRAQTDGAGRLTLGFLANRQVGFAIRAADGAWHTEPTHVLEVGSDEGLPGNVAFGWWGDAAVFAWIGEPVWQCACFGLQMSMWRAGRWLEYTVELHAGREAGAIDMALSADGRAVLPVGGGTFWEHGTDGLIAYESLLPRWSDWGDTTPTATLSE